MKWTPRAHVSEQERETQIQTLKISRYELTVGHILYILCKVHTAAELIYGFFQSDVTAAWK